MGRWAAAGGGTYYDAGDGEQLARSVEAALSTPVRVFAADGTLVGGTSVGGAALELDPGNYRVVVLAEPNVTFEAVHVPAGETIELRMPGS